jgi:hypothetical protein
MIDKSDKPSPLSRRRMFAGAGSVGALAAAAAVLPLAKTIAPAPPETLAKAPDAGGYQLTEHVQHYYRTARV